MAYSTISSSLYNVGKPIIKTLFSLIAANFTDIDTRITSLEGGGGKVEVFNSTVFNAAALETNDILGEWQATYNFSLITCVIQIYDGASALSTDFTIDVLKATDLSGTYSSVFSTKPSIDLDTASDYDSSVNHVPSVFSTTAVASGDFIQLKLIDKPAGPWDRFRITLIGEL